MDPADLRVIIPVGGEAKRLKPLTAEVSKAVVRIFNRPFVEFAMAELALQGVRNFIFGVKGYVNYKNLFDWFREGIDFSARYRISPRAHIKYQPLIDDVGSADSIRINMDYYDIKGLTMVVQGDNLFELNLRDLLAFHEEKGGVMNVVLTYVDDVQAYGIADIDSAFRIRRFVEKPKKDKAPSKLANTGIYLLSPFVREIFSQPQIQSMIRDGRRLDFGMDFIPFLIDHGYEIYGYILKGEWYDVGTPTGYLDTMLRILKSSERSKLYFGNPLPNLGKVWIQGESPESIRRREEIMSKVQEKKVRLEGSVIIGRHCQIGNGTIIRDSYVDNYCVVGNDVTIERSAIMDRVMIGDGAEIQDSIIGRHVRVKSSRLRPTWILGLSIIADDVVIGEGCFIISTKVFPHRFIADEQELVKDIVE